MDLFRRAEGIPQRLGILPGTFNPPTVAHLALARAARAVVDQVLFVLPRRFPHKSYGGASFEQRVAMLSAAAGDQPWISIAATEGGLFADIARECRKYYGAGVRLSFLCGRDAAERILEWDYGDPRALVRMFREFDLLVAARQGDFRAPEAHRDSFQAIDVGEAYHSLSATEVRRRVAAGEPWEHLVPAAIIPLVYQIYGNRPD